MATTPPSNAQVGDTPPDPAASASTSPTADPSATSLATAAGSTSGAQAATGTSSAEASTSGSTSSQPPEFPDEYLIEIKVIEGQVTKNTCWAACALMAYQAHAGTPHHLDQRALAKTLGVSTRRPQGIIEALKHLGMVPINDSDYLPTLNELKAEVSKGTPLIVVADAKGAMSGPHKSNEGQYLEDKHYMMLIGYRGDLVALVDPWEARSKACPQWITYPKLGTGDLAQPPALLSGDEKYQVQHTYYATNDDGKITRNAAARASSPPRATTGKRKAPPRSRGPSRVNASSAPAGTIRSGRAPTLVPPPKRSRGGPSS